MAIEVLLQVSKLIDQLELEEVDVASLPERLRVMFHLKARFDAQATRRVGALDRSREWANEQAGSCAGWLRRQCRVSKDEARSTVRRARHMGSMPWVAECWSAGAINTSHADAITTARNPAH